MTILTQPVPGVTGDTGEVERYLETRSRLDYASPFRASSQDVARLAAVARRRAPSPGSQEALSRRVSEARGGGERYGLGTAEGVTFRVSFSPGVLAVRSTDVQALDRDPASMADMIASYVVAGDPVPERASTREIVEWSGRSRSRMLRAIGELDLTPWSALDEGMTLGMVTLTLPGLWEGLAPDGQAFKRLVSRWRKRYERVFGPLRAVWKLEFQGRGAPHLHVLMPVPVLAPSPFCEDCETLVRFTGKGSVLDICRHWTFEEWLSWTWADVVDAEGMEWVRHVRAGTAVDFDTRKMADPRRIGIYFLGHSTKKADGKEYQHEVPELWQAPGAGPGRFWGFWNLDRAAVEVDVTSADYDRVRRVLRGIERAREKRAFLDARRHGKDRRERVQPIRSCAVGVGPRGTGTSFLPDGCGDGCTHEHRRKRKVRRIRRLRSLGVSGGNAGGWVLVNDGLAAGYAVTRLLDVTPAPPAPPVPAGTFRFQ